MIKFFYFLLFDFSEEESGLGSSVEARNMVDVNLRSHIIVKRT